MANGKDWDARLATISDLGVVKGTVRLATVALVPLMLWAIAEFRSHELAVGDRFAAQGSRIAKIETGYRDMVLPTLNRHANELTSLQAHRPRFDEQDARDMERRLIERLKEKFEDHSRQHEWRGID